MVAASPQVLKKRGAAGAAGCVEGLRKKVLKMDRPDGRRVLKFDGPSGRGLWIARRAMLKKSALRDLLSVPYGMISILVIGLLRSSPKKETHSLGRSPVCLFFLGRKPGCKGFIIRGRLL